MMPIYDNSMTGNSYNRMGGSYDYGYSRDNAYSHLEAAMRDARNEHEREEIRQLMSKLYR